MTKLEIKSPRKNDSGPSPDVVSGYNSSERAYDRNADLGSSSHSRTHETAKDLKHADGQRAQIRHDRSIREISGLTLSAMSSLRTVAAPSTEDVDRPQLAEVGDYRIVRLGGLAPESGLQAVDIGKLS